MPKHGKPAPKAEETDDSVKLKPILGIRPGLYLTVACAVVLALLVFFLLFYPGIRNRGSYMVISGDPARSSVLVDGTYAGTAPCTIFVKRGLHTVEVTRPHFTALKKEVNAPGRVFATLLVPQRRSFGYTLDLTDVDGLLAEALRSFVHYPLSIQAIEFAIEDTRTAMETDATGTVRQAVSAFVDNVMYLVTYGPQLRDLIYAAASAWSNGGPLTLGSLLDSVSRIAQLETQHQNLPFWFAHASGLDQSSPVIRKLMGSAWMQSYAARLSAEVSPLASEQVAGVGGPGIGQAVGVGGVTFRAVPAGTLLMGEDDLVSQGKASVGELLPHPVQVSRFFLAETEVTNAQFAAFASAVPQWKPSNRAALVQQGLASDGYLVGWTDDRFPAGADGLPVTGVSWHAAQAYCQWLSGGAAAAYAGSVVQLPTEAQYEWAARGGLRGRAFPTGDNPGSSVFFTTGIKGPGRTGASGPNGYGLSDMAGNVWEWCRDSFAPAAYLLASLDPVANRDMAADLPPSDVKVVRGGSWADAKDIGRVYSRGAQPADWCTPYLGFRPSLVLP